MSNNRPHGQDTDDLMRQVDSILEGKPIEKDWLGDEVWLPGEPIPGQDINIDEYTPAEAQSGGEQIFYQNYSNDYGRQVRNYQNGYGGQENAPEPEPPRSPGSIPAYNGDRLSQRPRRTDTLAYKQQQKTGTRETAKKIEYRDYGVTEPEEQPRRSAPARRRFRLGCGGISLILLAVLIAIVVGVWMWVFDAPESTHSIGQRKRDTAAILICGTDADRTRTDTMMLLYVSGSERRVGLLSLPRDTYTVTAYGDAAKLNSAYGRNGGGEAGQEEEAMEIVLDYVQDIIGYRPDGYILVDMSFVTQFVDAMGGVEVEVPMDIETDGVAVSAGMQHLDGEETLALLRHRKSYANADLGRVEVQRLVIKACMDQWIRADRADEAMYALALIENGTVSSLSARNYLWVAKTVLTSMSGGFTTETLPGYADYIAGGSYYILNPDEVAELINESFNPYEAEITAADLNIAG